MIVVIGNFLFRYRNALFPLVYGLLFLPSHPLISNYRVALGLGFLVALTGQLLRVLTIGLDAQAGVVALAASAAPAKSFNIERRILAPLE